MVDSTSKGRRPLLKITVVMPMTDSVVGSCDDSDSTNGPGKSYAVNGPAGAATDGGSAASSTCLAPAGKNMSAHLRLDAIAATTPRSSSPAKANAKAVTKSKLVITYSFIERLLFFVARIKPKLAAQVAVNLNVSVNTGPCGAGFTLFILNGPTGINPVPNWQGLYSVAVDSSDATKLKVTRPDGIVDNISNPGNAADWPDLDPVWIAEGQYDLTFETNAVASADGTVSIRYDASLFLWEYSP